MFSGRAFAYGAAASLAIAVTGYIFWGPTDKKKRKKNASGLCPGLKNTGTSCFLNANLQALAPCVSFCKWLSSRSSNLLNRNTFAVTLNRVLKDLNRDAETEEEYCPDAVIDGLKKKNWVIPTGENDSHELLMAMVTTLNEDDEKESTSLFDISWVRERPGGLNGGFHSNVVVARDHNQNEYVEKIEPQPFRGYMANLLGCKMCQYKYPVRCEPFEGITLNIPPTSYCHGQLSLETLLRFWAMPETIQGASCESCNSQNTVMVKMAKIAKLPQTLSLNIQRVVIEHGVPVKSDRKIRFPEVLPLGDYLYKGTHTYTVQRPTTLASTRLLGGKNGYKMPLGSRTPPLRSPNSRPLNLLKARNYYTRDTLNSLSVGLPSMGPKDMLSDASRAAVEQLATTYQTETRTEVHNTPYKLVSVIVHIGNASTGHFVTYRRAPAHHGQRFPERWVFTSDSYVRGASLAEVLNSQPYMLFYERI